MKKIFRVMSSICAAGIMAISAVGMSGCTFWETWRDIKYGVAATGAISFFGVLSLWQWFSDGCPPAKSDLQIVTETLSVGNSNLWAAIGANEEAAEVVYYDLFYGEASWVTVSVIDFRESLRSCLSDGYFWLPLPMPENAALFFEGKAEKYLSSTDIEKTSLDGVNGYWYYSRLSDRNPVNEPYFIVDQEVEEYSFTDRLYEISWYDVDRDWLYVIREEWAR